MDAALLFTFIYPIVPIIGVAAYIPQLAALHRKKVCARRFTLPTWYLWLVASIASVGYGVFVLQDMMFIITCVLHTLAQIWIVTMVLYRRFGYALREMRDKAMEHARDYNKQTMPQQVCILSLLWSIL